MEFFIWTMIVTHTLSVIINVASVNKAPDDDVMPRVGQIVMDAAITVWAIALVAS